MSRRIDQFDVVAFDADDTLWRSEDSFRHAEHRFVELVAPYASAGVNVEDALKAVERADISVTGYGVKAFTLSMVRAAINVTEGRIPSMVVGELADLGRRCSSRTSICSLMSARCSPWCRRVSVPC